MFFLKIGIISALWVNKPVYGIFRILAGMGYRGAIMIATVIASESVPSKYKVMFIFIPHIGFNVGEVIIAIESYFIRDWQMLQLVEYSPIFAFAFLCLVLPNPARWLLSKGWNQKARKVLEVILNYFHSINLLFLFLFPGFAKKS